MPFRVLKRPSIWFLPAEPCCLSVEAFKGQLSQPWTAKCGQPISSLIQEPCGAGLRSVELIRELFKIKRSGVSSAGIFIIALSHCDFGCCCWSNIMTATIAEYEVEGCSFKQPHLHALHAQTSFEVLEKSFKLPRGRDKCCCQSRVLLI